VRRAALAAATVGALVALWGPGAGAALPARSVPTAVRSATRSQAPFPGLTATVVHVGGHPLHVVVAKTETERELGLRRRSNLGRYDGMLFVFDQTSLVSFTMSTVPVPLEIGFYATNGQPVERLLMEPCPRAENDCPIYTARRSFRYALETLTGGLPRGALSG
jgi:uncharacterized membrane protein (UPF0127 family)